MSQTQRTKKKAFKTAPEAENNQIDYLSNEHQVKDLEMCLIRTVAHTHLPLFPQNTSLAFRTHTRQYASP